MSTQLIQQPAPFAWRNLTDFWWWLETVNWLGAHATDHIKRMWWAWAVAVAALWSFSHFFWIGINVTESLPWKVAIVKKWDKAGIQRDDVVAFRWHGGGPYPEGMTFTKIIKGVPGDVVTIDGRTFSINGQALAEAKDRGRKGQELKLGPSGVIPEGAYFVWTPHKDSLDSRYEISGWIKQEALVGKAVVLF